MCVPEVWTKIGSPAQIREKQEVAKEKPKLGNARRLGGIDFIDPDDEEYKEILKHARRVLERPCGTSHAVWKITKWLHESDCEAGNCIREFQYSVWLKSRTS